MSDAGRCATCRFMAAKREEPGWADEPAVFHTCVRVIHGNSGEAGLLNKYLAVVIDGSGYAARLMVQPEFGCVLHETGVFTPLSGDGGD